MSEDSRNVSVQFQGARELDRLEAYDEFVEETNVFANRSEAIRGAMRMQRELYELLDELDRLPNSPTEARMYVRQPLVNLIHAEDQVAQVRRQKPIDSGIE